MAAQNALRDGALRFMQNENLSPMPVNYELGYIMLTDPQCVAARTVEAIRNSGECVSQAQANHVVAAHRALARAGAEEDPNSTKLRHQALHLADLASDAAAATGQFGRDLADELDELSRDGQPVAAIVSDMIGRTDETERQLQSALARIETLREDVAAACDDAARDALTGLANRRGVKAAVEGCDPSCRRALAVVDIDRFKLVNDRHGHPVGDRVLKAVAEALAESCAPHLVARWGGEEFVVIFNGVSPDAAHAIVDAARRDLKERKFRIRENNKPVGAITFCAGVVAMEGHDLDRAMRDADVLLYKAKDAGRDLVLTDADKAIAA